MQPAKLPIARLRRIRHSLRRYDTASTPQAVSGGE
jgi:hypothetical protein